MKLRRYAQGAAIAVAAAAMVGAAANNGSQAKMEKPGASQMKMLRPDAIQWAPAPPELPKGAQAAVLQGDPTQQGYFAMRLKAPDGYRIGPHTHPTDELVTVVSGTLHVGTGRTFDKASAQAYPAGSYLVMPTGMTHYVWADGETVVQITGQGPFAINYVNPQDDPRQQGVGGAGQAQTPGTQSP